mmetsp:Transcript_76492/g.169518  ORF Transcript_76492/g.169518 Transcript_76492/m.169518 type:complete len:987 (+) Transcript_76492:84-3044(+)
MGFGMTGATTGAEDRTGADLERGVSPPLSEIVSSNAVCFLQQVTLLKDSAVESANEASAERCAVLKVGGMTCSNCSSAVERSLSKMAQVERCEVDLINEKAQVWYHPSASFSPQDLCEEVEDIGFEASLLADAEVAGSSAEEGGRALLHFACADGTEASAAAFLQAAAGVFDVVVNGAFLKVTYDPETARARVLLKGLEAEGCKVTVDPGGSAAVRATGDGSCPVQRSLIAAVILTGAIVLVCWVLPCFRHCMKVLEVEVVPGLQLMTIIMAGFATPVMVICGRRFHVGAYHSLKSGVWDMNVLISFGTSLTFGYSVAVTIFAAVSPKVFGYHSCKAPPLSYFEAPCTVITFLLVGKTLETWARGKTSESLRDLLGLQPAKAHLFLGGDMSTEPVTMPVELLELGDTLQVFPGEAAPTDGLMVSKAGVAAFDESLLTGESRPVTKSNGDFIIGGSRCVSGRVELKVERLGSSTMLSQIMSLVEQAQLSRAPVQQVADRVAHYFVPFVVCLAITTWITWFVLVYRLKAIAVSSILSGRQSEWIELDRLFFVLEHGLTVLLVACPCALGLATPTAVMTSTGVAAKLGILIRNGAVPLEIGSKVTRVVLDKTGTLTCGQPQVKQVAALCPSPGNGDPDSPWKRLTAACREAVGDEAGGEALFATTWLQDFSGGATKVVLPGTEGAAGRSQARLEAERALWWAIGSAEMSSEHPLAKALTAVAGKVVRAPLTKPSDFKNITGVGVQCIIQGLEVRVASAQHICGLQTDSSSAAVLEWVQAVRGDGSTVVAVALDGVPLAAVALCDRLTPHAKACVAELQIAGAEVWMCTGDHVAAAGAVAKECGIDASRVVAEALPADKVALVRRLQAPTADVPNFVSMVGDGVNDAPALAAADLGVAIGAGHNVTVDAADIVLVRTDLRDLTSFFYLARKTLRIIWLNFLWALLFNTCALPVAAGACWHWRVTMTPQIAVCLMMTSSFLVVFTSLSLKI